MSVFFGPKTVEEFMLLNPWQGVLMVDFAGGSQWRAMLAPLKDRHEWGNVPVAYGCSPVQAINSLMALQVNEKGELCESL